MMKSLFLTAVLFIFQYNGNLGYTVEDPVQCQTAEGKIIAPGESYPSNNCQKYCTCDQFGFLGCTDWCKTQLITCNEGDPLERTVYGEEFGDSGCKRCIKYVCDHYSE